MTGYAELEISLHRRGMHRYAVELRFSKSGRDSIPPLVRVSAHLVQFDMPRLHTLANDPAMYGEVLSASLFSDGAMQQAFSQARHQARSPGVPLRVRLFIGPSALELHALHWETLHDPEDHTVLLTSEQTIFSRYLSSIDWQPVRLRPRATLRALVVIANPTDLAAYQPHTQPLAPIDVETEYRHACSYLGETPTTILASGIAEAMGTPNLHSMMQHQSDGYDILYLVAHTALVGGEPSLWLERDDGTADVVSGSTLATWLRDLPQRPRLVLLVCCQQRGPQDVMIDQTDGHDRVSDTMPTLHSPLSIQLVEAGIPAVLAMQSSISHETLALLLPVFFRELQHDGEVDHALTVARKAVYHRPDWWVPALFLRLKSGCLWYVPGFRGGRRGLERWPTLIRHIRRGNCTPIIGPRLTQSLLGSPSEIARRWAEDYEYPMAPYERDHLAQVAQYLAVNQDLHFPRVELTEYLRQDILQRYGHALPPELHQATLSELFAELGRQRRENNPADPYKVLAELPCPIYITTNLSNLLVEALIAVGKEPRVELCRWNNQVKMQSALYEHTHDYWPDAQHPLVYYLFGTSDQPDSIVLTQDDYFDYLIGVTENKDLIPPSVRRALTDTALLFLGFQVDDWDFRVLFRSIIRHEGHIRRKKYAHAAAQIEPQESRTLEPERARRYLETYFEGANIDIFWGSVEDFVHALLSYWSGEAAPDRSTGHQ